MKVNRTERNLWTAFLEEAKANRLYTAYAIKALAEGHPEAAQAFLEAAGAETVHALSHLQALGAVKSTVENLQQVVEEEAREAATMYPALLRQALEEGHQEAAQSFRLAMEGEGHHRDIFARALQDLLYKRSKSITREPTAAPLPPARDAAATDRALARGGPEARAGWVKELEREKPRIEALTRLREVIFGLQDGLVSVATLTAAIAAAGAATSTVLLGGLATGLGGMLSMAAGSYLGSQAEREIQEAEIAGERWEIEHKPEEEMAELIALYRQEGMSYQEAESLATRIAADRDLWLRTMAEKELGLSAEVIKEPQKDAAVMGGSFFLGALVPLLPYLFLSGNIAIAVSVTATLLSLFTMGAAKAKLVRRNPFSSGLQTLLIGSAAAFVGYLLGRSFPGA
ncbi:MAG TPA: VIT1/CCC1 transporter family protein [Dehalococcoidia bacterium]|nr:VIT1/CCC1 transporter family protein [Dehalococcoidia bacterium]